jgi:hypothetical protein
MKDNTGNDMVRLLKKLRKKGVELSLLRTGTPQFTNFHLVTKEENALVGKHYAAIAAHLKAQTKAAKPKRTPKEPPKVEEEEELPIPAEWYVEDEAAAFSSLGSVVIRPSPLSGISLRATFSGIVRERVEEHVAFLLSNK